MIITGGVIKTCAPVIADRAKCPRLARLGDGTQGKDAPRREKGGKLGSKGQGVEREKRVRLLINETLMNILRNL